MNNERLFRDESVGKAIAKTSIPAVATILVMLVYNMADIFFIGRTGDAMQVAAVSLASPVMAIISGMGTLVGSGGCAAIAIELGKSNRTRAMAMASFCCWVSIALGVIITLALLLVKSPLLSVLGASQNTEGFAASYLSVITLGIPFMLFSSSSASIVRAEGAVKESMLGNGLGSIVNVILDPLFISTFKLGVTGAAIATVIGNVVATAYFVHHYHKKSSLSIHPRHFSVKNSIPRQVLSLGLPTAIGVFLSSISHILRNNFAVQYGDVVVAAMAVSGKITMLITMVQMGICTGVQPLMAYNYGANNLLRLKAIIKRTGGTIVLLGSALTLLVLLGKKYLIAAFIPDPTVIELGQYISSITIISGPVFGLCYLSTNFLQATEKPSFAILVSLMRQGIFLMPLMVLLNSTFGFTGLLCSYPVADLLTTAAALFLFARHYTYSVGERNHSGQAGI